MKQLRPRCPVAPSRLLIAVALLAAVAVLLHPASAPLRRVARRPPPPIRVAVALSDLPLLPPSAPARLPAHAELRKQSHFPGSLGESIRLHVPFLVAEGRPALPPNVTFSCTAYDRTPLDTALCRNYSARQNFGDVPLRYTDMRRGTVPPRCADVSAIVFVLGVIPGNDHNACHLLMRLLMAWHVVQRLRLSPGYLPHAPPRSVLVLLVKDPRLRSSLLAEHDSFHAGLLRRLFINQGVPVFVPRSFQDVHVRCFRAAIVLKSFANRLSFPDARLGDNMGYHGQPSLRAPLSSDALVLRSAAFPRPPPMRYKLLYVARSRNGHRAWTADAEDRFRAMLQRVAREEGATLELFAVRRGDPALPPLGKQLAAFGDAAVVVGFHGAGLALCSFAPRGAAVVEIWPHGFGLHLFQTLVEYGLRHYLIKLGSKSAVMWSSLSRLPEEDLLRMETVVRDQLRRGKEIVAGGPLGDDVVINGEVRQPEEVPRSVRT